MKFEYLEYNKRVTDEELIEDMKRVSHEYNFSSMSMREYSQYGRFDCSTISRRFGTWNDALAIARIGVKNKFWTEEELFENLEYVWVMKGSQPRRRDMDDKSLSRISSGAYLRHYGKWSEALKSFVNYINEPDFIIKESPKQVPLHQTKRDINLRLRFLVMKRDNFKCCVCGASPAKDSTVELHIDHKIPWAKGGETVIENLQTLCSKCNLGKSDIL
ncbi:MAG: HNH endonuclease [Clostridia bacterium]|nr:HNH endonuclease [Clostridia bacterium]